MSSRFIRSVAYMRYPEDYKEVAYFLKLGMKAGYFAPFGIDDHYLELEEGYTAFTEMVSDIMTEGNSIKVITVPSIDHLGDDPETQNILLCYLAAKGLHVVEITEKDVLYEGEVVTTEAKAKSLSKDLPIDLIKLFALFSHTDKLIDHIGLLPSDLANDPQNKSRSAGAPGYYREQPAVLKRIKKLRRKHKGQKQKSFQEIANILNSEGIKTIQGKTWTRQNVRKLFSSDKMKNIRLHVEFPKGLQENLTESRSKAMRKYIEKNPDGIGDAEMDGAFKAFLEEEENASE